MTFGTILILIGFGAVFLFLMNRWMALRGQKDESGRSQDIGMSWDGNDGGGADGDGGD